MNKPRHFFRIELWTIIYLSIACLLGYSDLYVKIFYMVVFHEMCHLLVAYLFHIKVNQMVILPFGAYLKIPYLGQYHALKEMILALAGPISHVFYHAILMVANASESLLYLNRLMMVFNLLPIYPLDGYRIFLSLLAYLFPYRYVLLASGLLSMIMLLMMILAFHYPYYYILYGYLMICNIKNIYHIDDQYFLFLYYRGRFAVYYRLKRCYNKYIYRPYLNVKKHIDNG